MNKLITALVFLLSVCSTITAQVGIGTTTPEASAALDVSSTNKGFLMPRMTTAQREAIATPANSLMVFDTDTNSQWIYVDTAWVESKAGVGKFIDGTSPEIAYYPERVGIGIDNPSATHRLFVRGIRTSDNTNTAVKIEAQYDGSGTSPFTLALSAETENLNAATIDVAVGTQGIVGNSNAGGTINWAIASRPQVYNSGNIGYSSGLLSETTNRSGTITTVRGQDIYVLNESGASMGQPSLASLYFTNEGTISGDAYGMFIGGDGSGSVAGNSYGLYLSTPFSNVTGTAYAFYSDNVNDSYMAGNLGVGTLVPQQKVHITGVLRLEPQAVAPTGGLGDFYVNTDGTLYFHNGTDWKAVKWHLNAIGVVINSVKCIYC